MKTKLLLTACAAALVFGAPSYAAPNKSTVEQSGARNSASVTQNSTSATTGSSSTIKQKGTSAAPAKTTATVIQGQNDESTIEQGFDGTGNDFAKVTQVGVVGGFSKITQTGGGNSAIVGQSDNGSAAGFAGKVTSSTITQTGSGDATVTQTYSIIPASPFTVPTVSVIEQDGANIATVIQLDLGQDSTIRQGAGGNNQAFVTQGDGVLVGGESGDVNVSDVDQRFSSGGFVDVYQTNGSQSFVTQNGNASDAFVDQRGPLGAFPFQPNQSFITQADLGLASLIQSGSGNFSKITQDSGIYSQGLAQFPITTPDGKGYASVADVKQTGDSNSSTIGQSGNSNLAVVTQNGLTGTTDVNFADISQTGDQTIVDLTQNESGNRFTSKQGGNASTAVVTQSAGFNPFDFNEILLEQGLTDGVGAYAEIDQAGGFNFANVKQTGNFTGNVPGPVAFGTRRANAVYIQQLATGEDAGSLVVEQSGEDNLFDVTQIGGASIDGFTQSGTRNLFDLTQTADAGTLLTVALSSQSGTDGIIQGSQTGGDNTLTFTQSGTTNVTRFSQGGTNNSATFTQGGSDNFINLIDQIGDGNTATFEQFGSVNEAILTQIGDRNTSTITQNAGSSLNTATVTQGALGAPVSDAFSEVTQSDSENLATVSQYANFSSSTIIQSGTGNEAIVTQGQLPQSPE